MKQIYLFILLLFFSGICLNAQIVTLSGSCSSTVDGTYTLSSTVNGKPSYINGSFRIEWSSTRWELLNSGNVIGAYNNSNTPYPPSSSDSAWTDVSCSGGTYTYIESAPKLVSIERQNPNTQNFDDNQVVFRVTFDKDVNNVDTTDFSLTSAIGGTINSISSINKKTYEVTVSNIDITNGTLGLNINGIDASGSNNITETTYIPDTESVTVNQANTNDYLNQDKIGQTFQAITSNYLTSFTIFPQQGQHSFSGSVSVKIYNGDESSGGTEISSEIANITNSTAASGQKITLKTPISVTSGNTYSIILSNYSGSGTFAIASSTSGTYANGVVIFTGRNNTSHLAFDLKIQIYEGTIKDGPDGEDLSSNTPTTDEIYNRTINTFTTSGNWSDINNWSMGTVPTQINSAIIASNQVVTLDVNNLQINNFKLEANATLNIPKDKEITIQNTFTTNGNLELESDKNDSGVLLVEGTTSGTITYKRGGLLANEWYIVTPPVSGQTVKTFAENAANDIRINTTPDPDRYAIATYDDSRAAGNRWVYYDTNVNAADEFIAGQSYSMSRATDGTVTFTGTLTVNNLQKTLIAGQWNAIGNPFTTYYPANKNSSSSFLSENLNKLDENFPSLYIWDDAQSKYIAVTELDATSRSLPPGQGFFIKMKTGETEVLFNKAKRTTKPASGTTNFSKSEKTPNITITVSKENINVNTSIKFFENATTGFDAGYDIGNFNSTGLDIYSHLVDKSNTKNYTIQSLSNTNFDNIVIPISVRAKKGDNVFISRTTNNIPTDVKTYLEDRIQNTFTELKINSKKNIIIENDGVTKNKYYIHLSKKSLNVTKNTINNDVTLYSNNNRLFIHNLKEEGSILLHSLLGKEVFLKKIKATSKLEIPITNLAKGVYIATLKTVNGSISRKIILE